LKLDAGSNAAERHEAKWDSGWSQKQKADPLESRKLFRM
jgi:hypothetical protein